MNADGTSLPLKDKSVDVFLSNFVLEHVEDEKAYLEEMKRCVKDKGIIILSVPRPLWYFAYFFSLGPYFDALRKFRDFINRPSRFYTHGHPKKHSIVYELYEWKEKRYEELFKNLKLNIIRKYRTCNILSLNVHYAKIFGSINMPEALNVHTTYVLGVAQNLKDMERDS